MASKPTSAKPARKVWTHDMARFDDCIECRFYRMFHTHEQCKGCEIGENFDFKAEELDPTTPLFLSKKSR